MPTKKTTKKTVKKTPARAPRKADFDDEDAVLREVARQLDIPADELSIKRGSSPNGYGDAYVVSVGHSRKGASEARGGRGGGVGPAVPGGGTGKEWYVMRDEDEFEDAAVEGTKQSIEDEPESFGQFLEEYINLDRLRRDLHSDVQNSNYESLADEAKQHPMEFLKEHNIDIPEPTDKQVQNWAKAEEKTADDIHEFRQQDAENQWLNYGDDPEVDDSIIEQLAESLTNEQLRDPIGYLEDIYGKEQATAQAMKIAGIDTAKAAKDAVRYDGAAHFMCGYDGNYDTTKPSGFVVWRHN